jgi:hypothetical protein
MGLVNLLRFDQDSGAAVSDEEYWNIFFRQKHFCDNLHPLLEDDMAAAWDMEVLYGGTGYPALHHETVLAVRDVLRQTHGAGPEASPPATIKEIARIAFDEMRRAVRRRIDQKLDFFYGCDTDSVNGGTVSRDGATFPLAKGPVSKAVRKLAAGDTQDPLLRQVFETKAVIFGFDSQVGITAYHLSPENYICGYVHEGFECIGQGKYASGLSLGRDFRSRTMMMRKAGYPPAEGLFELLASALLAKDHFKEVGGNIQIVLLDRKSPTREGRYREIFDNQARLAGEVVKAQMAGLLSRDDAIALLEALVFKGKDPASVEADLFKKAGDDERLMLVLRGYKLREIPLLLPGKSTKSAAKGGRK